MRPSLERMFGCVLLIRAHGFAMAIALHAFFPDGLVRWTRTAGRRRRRRERAKDK